MGDSGRERLVSELSQRMFQEILGDIMLDTMLEAHREIGLARAICKKCHTRCQLASTPCSTVAANGVAGPSRAPSPFPLTTKGANGASGINGKDKSDAYFACTICERSIASPRYAQHLSLCMGGGAVRRGGPRNAVSKIKAESEKGRSQSPYVASERGEGSDDEVDVRGTPKGKANAKNGKKKMIRTGSKLMNGNNKRVGPPLAQTTPTKKHKKQKFASNATVPPQVVSRALNGAFKKSSLPVPSSSQLMKKSPTPSQIPALSPSASIESGQVTPSGSSPSTPHSPTPHIFASSFGRPGGNAGAAQTSTQVPMTWPVRPPDVKKRAGDGDYIDVDGLPDSDSDDDDDDDD